MNFGLYIVYGYVVVSVVRITHSGENVIADEQNLDRQIISLSKSNQIDQRKAELLDTSLTEAQKTNDLDLMTWLYFGKIYSFAELPDLSFNTYYMAHLKDHKLIKTNSQLQFDTNAAKFVVDNDKSNIDEEIIKKLLNG